MGLEPKGPKVTYSCQSQAVHCLAILHGAALLDEESEPASTVLRASDFASPAIGLTHAERVTS